MALPVIIPLAVGALLLAGCAKAITDARQSRPLETDFIQTLQNTRRAEGTHKSLTLYGADGGVLMELKRRDWD